MNTQYTYKMILAYDGGKFNGWQKQGNTKNTIQEKLEAVLSAYMGETVELQGSGRTDRGVHGAGQVASFVLEEERDCREIRGYCNRYLPEAVRVLSVEPAEEGFHARLKAKEKTYVYRLWDGEVSDVFRRDFLWHCHEVTGRIDVEAVNVRLAELIGERDFKDFTHYSGKKSTVRTLYEARAQRYWDLVEIRFRGNGFLYNQVRMMTGWAVTGEKYTAPSKGLCLEEVRY